MHAKQNNVKAGLLVVVSILLIGAVLVMISNGIKVFGTETYEVRFGLQPGAGGLRPGSAVTLGGQPVGSVWSVRFDESATGSGYDKIKVRIRIRGDVAVRDDATIFLIKPLLGGRSELDILDLGTGAPLADGAWIDGSLAPPSFLEQAGFGGDEVARVQSIIANVESASANLNDVMGELGVEEGRSIKQIIADGETAAANVKTMTTDATTVVGDVRERYPAWADRIDNVMSVLESETGEITSLVEARLVELETFIASAQSMIDENRQDIDQTIDSTRELMAGLNEQRRVKLDALLDEGTGVVAEAEQIVGRVDALIGEQAPNVRRSIANAQLATYELRETVQEVRRTPWRLLYRPDMQELEHELLYESARRYAAAVTDLRSVTDALEALSAIDESQMPGRDTSMGELLEALNESFDRYREAEQAFLREIVSE